MRALAALAPILIASCALFREPGLVINGWEFATPAPLPAGATTVPLQTESIPARVAPNTELRACPAALILPFTVRYVPDDEARPVRYITDDGRELVVIWQIGFSARHTDELQIVAPDGKVVAREGQRVEGLGGGYWAGGGVPEAAHVCLGDYVPRRVGQ